jgi:Protein of unknown function (DUF3024)
MAVPLPETDVARACRWVTARNDRRPDHAIELIRFDVDIEQHSVTVLECRPPWRPEFGTDWTRFRIDRFRYNRTRREWQIYWRDRNIKFHIFPLVPPSQSIDDLLVAVDADPTAIFWG